MVSRVVQSLTVQIEDDSVPSISVTVYKMKHEVNEYLRRKEIHRVLSSLPTKYTGQYVSVAHNSAKSHMSLETQKY